MYYVHLGDSSSEIGTYTFDNVSIEKYVPDTPLSHCILIIANTFGSKN